MSATRVISLDLDDTLWPVGPVIAAAEAALLDWLRRAIRGPCAGTTSNPCAPCARAIASAVSRAQPRPDVPAPPRARRAIRRGRLCRVARATRRSRYSSHARNRVEFYDDVRPALERLRARYRLFALSNGNADLAALRNRPICSTVTSRRSPRAPPSRMRASSRRSRDMAGVERRRDPARRRRSARRRGRRAAGGHANRVAQPRCARVAGRARAAGAHHLDARGDSLAPTMMHARDWQPTASIC